MSLDGSIGEKIRQAREEEGLTLEVLAHAIDVSIPEMRALENGQQRISAKSLFGVSKALNLEVRWFFDTDNKESTSLDCEIIRDVKFKDEYPEILRNLRLNKTLEELCAAANQAKMIRDKTKKVA